MLSPKSAAQAAESFNLRLERLMPVMTPVGVLLGFAFPLAFIRLRPFIPWLFSAMTLSGALKLRLRDLGRALADPFPLILFFVSAHVIIPLLVFLPCSLVFRNDPDTVSGYVLLFSVPTAVSGFIWVSIYRGDGALALALIFLDTLLTPLVVPGTVSALLGTAVALDIGGVAFSLMGMVVLPTITGVAAHEISRGKIPPAVTPYLNPFSKFCIVLVIGANASAVAPRVDPADPKVWVIALLSVVFAAFGYGFSRLAGIAAGLAPEKRTTLFFAAGLRNLSAATTIAIEYFPATAALPALLGIVFQQTLAAVMGRVCLSGHRKR
ncbi:MAG: bile acid:sodium symporter family protein [Spirochaetaceae bacterium]|jgi:tagaturonate reductase|nr:bile acid:sodium symporter family protein [Spirochaetaceae bacterium]